MPDGARAAPALNAAPLPAPGNRYWACPPWQVFFAGRII